MKARHNGEGNRLTKQSLQTVLVRERLGGVGTGAPTSPTQSEMEEVAAERAAAKKAAASADKKAADVEAGAAAPSGDSYMGLVSREPAVAEQAVRKALEAVMVSAAQDAFALTDACSRSREKHAPLVGSHKET